MLVPKLKKTLHCTYVPFGKSPTRAHIYREELYSMKYCIFIANFLPNLGGVERYTYNLAKKLIAKGNEVTVITSNVFGLEEHEIIEGIEIYRIPCINLLGGRFPVLKPSRDFFRMNREMLKKEFDFAIIQSRFYVHCAYGVHFAKKKGLPRLVLEHGTNHFTVNNPLLDWAGALYEHLISAYIRANCTSYYGVSQACCDWLSHFKIQASGKLYNAGGADGIREKLASPGISYRKEDGLLDSVVVTYTGRLVKEKGIQKLVEAVNLLKKRDIRVKLLVAGSGGLYEELAQRNDPDVILLGLLDFDHVVALLKETDIFCLPTDYPEGFPTSVLEAAACGCYVITTTKGGSRELIPDGSYGAILESNTAEEIADAIQRAVLDEAYRESAAQKALTRLNASFTWDKTSEEVMRIAEDMVKA